MDEKEKQIFQIIKKNKRREKLKNFLQKSKLVWILDPYPYETHKFHPRSVVESSKRDNLRNKYSWHNIARLQNEATYKAGLAGIITAPILAGISKNQSLSFNVDFPIQMAFAFLSGLLFVLATFLYQKRAPYFVQEYIKTPEQKKYKSAPIRQIRSSIFLEFLKLGRTIEITPENIHELSNHQTAFKTAGILLVQGGSCFKIGFDVVGQAHLEKLIFELSKKHKFKILTEYKQEDGETGLNELNGPSVIYHAGEIHLRHLHIQKAKEHFVSVLNPERSKVEIKDNDIVIDFYDPYIQTADQIDKNQLREPYTTGLDNLVQEEFLDTFVQELSYWQSWQRPFSRVLTLCLYNLSLLSFVIFLFFQSIAVWEAVQT